MGCSMSSEEKIALARAKELDEAISQDKERLRNEIKMLLLGAGESGKSTVVKQMKIIHENGFSNAESKGFKDIIQSGVITSMQCILRALPHLGLELSDPAIKEYEKRLLDADESVDGAGLDQSAVEAIQGLWANDVIKTAYDRRTEYYIVDSADYFFDNIERVGSSSYMPNEADILRCRVKTTGVNETEFEYRSLHFRMFDVGGQRSERKKWIHCFDSVTAIIFCVAMSEYDMTLLEDKTMNRMHESLKLFDSICNSQWFVETSVILFLNKMDLFQAKIGTSSLKKCFPDYEGPDTYDQAAEFIQGQFESLNQNPDSKTIYTQFTCATDTENVKFVFAAVTDIIFQNNLRNCGLL